MLFKRSGKGISHENRRTCWRDSRTCASSGARTTFSKSGSESTRRLTKSFGAEASSSRLTKPPDPWSTGFDDTGRGAIPRKSGVGRNGSGHAVQREMSDTRKTLIRGGVVHLSAPSRGRRALGKGWEHASTPPDRLRPGSENRPRERAPPEQGEGDEHASLHEGRERQARSHHVG